MSLVYTRKNISPTRACNQGTLSLLSCVTSFCSVVLPQAGSRPPLSRKRDVVFFLDLFQELVPRPITNNPGTFAAPAGPRAPHATLFPPVLNSRPRFKRRSHTPPIPIIPAVHFPSRKVHHDGGTQHPLRSLNSCKRALPSFSVSV